MAGPSETCVAEATAPAGSPTEFQKLAVARAAMAVAWLRRSIEACGGAGSAAWYSRCYSPFRGWGWPYPETTGYLIPTLIRYAQFAGQPEIADLAMRQADWVLSLQMENGALPAGVVIRGKREGPSVFNSGQMIFGLVAAADHTHDQKYLDAASRAARWLAGEVDETAGTWTAHAYVKGYSPAYYTRVCWPMLEVYSRTGEQPVKQAAVRVLDTIIAGQQPNGAIANWGFAAGRPAFTHTIAYTLRGLLESGRLLGDEGERFTQAALKPSDVLRRRLELRGRLAGAYDLDFKGRYWYTCLTGNCQMALVWMRVCDLLNDARYFSTALKTLQFVIDRQRIRHPNPNVHGAIAGSSPVWGRYMAMRIPNWAAKFFVDALMESHARLQRLSEAGPCASS